MIQRWECAALDDHPHRMAECEDGDWVAFYDVEPMLARLDAEIERISEAYEAEIDALRARCDQLQTHVSALSDLFEQVREVAASVTVVAAPPQTGWKISSRQNWRHPDGRSVRFDDRDRCWRAWGSMRSSVRGSLGHGETPEEAARMAGFDDFPGLTQ